MLPSAVSHASCGLIPILSLGLAKLTPAIGRRRPAGGSRVDSVLCISARSACVCIRMCVGSGCQPSCPCLCQRTALQLEHTGWSLHLVSLN